MVGVVLRLDPGDVLEAMDLLVHEEPAVLPWPLQAKMLNKGLKSSKSA